VVPNSVTTSRGECGRRGLRVHCFLGDMPVGTTATVTIKVTPQDDGTITNTATVIGILKDENPGNETAETQTTVSSPPCPATATRIGTDGNDTLTGTNNSDRILGRGGNDRINGLLGNDCLFGEAGRDTIRGDAGRDRVDGGADGDFLSGGSGTDTFAGGSGDDRIFAADGFAETINCGPGTDTVSADATDTQIDCESAAPF
jgi:Ca2+-binding RTX toxin-like protein